MRALAVTVPILYQWQTEVRTTTSVWKPHPITEGLGGVVHNDPVFLKVLLRHLADKLSLSSTLDIMADNLEERLLVYMKTIQPDHRITSVNHAMQALHCSRRQLQRALKKLCEQGILMHERKGHYILAKQKAFPQ